MGKRTTCRITGKPLVPLFSLGDIYVSDFLSDGEEPDSASKIELALAIEPESGLVQLTNTANFDAMYKHYWYNSGTNESMVKELTDIVDSICEVKALYDTSRWLDIGCNDGTLISKTPVNIYTIGVDPALNQRAMYHKAKKVLNEIHEDYFKANLLDGPVDVITSIAMFYDLEDPTNFCQDIHAVLSDDGLWVLQLSYLPLMIEQMAFDNICHEHLEYYTLITINNLLSNNGFKIVDAQINDTNGGSVRVYAQKVDAPETSFGSAPFRDVANMRVNSLLCFEETGRFRDPDYYKEFFNNIEKEKRRTVEFIKQAKAAGKTVWGYGASTKGNTLLQYYGLDHTMIDAIADRQPSKFGLRTVGTNIPICSEDEMRQANPDYMLMLPWHFVNSFINREKEYLDGGGAFIVPCPKFEVISCG